MESMTQAPHLLPGSRAGFRFGDTAARRLDDLRRPVLRLRPAAPWAARTEKYAAAGRHRRASPRTSSPPPATSGPPRAMKDGLLRRRDRPGRRSPSARATRSSSTPTRASAATPPPSRSASCGPPSTRTGNITAGNASRSPTAAPPSSSCRRPRPSGSALTPLGEVVGYGQVAGPDPSLLTQPSRRHQGRARPRPARTSRDVDLFELNEAFAAVGLASMDDLGITDDVVNVNGGAIALGHPIGMSRHPRARSPSLHELKRRGGGLGAAALCGGGGQGDAILLRTRSAPGSLLSPYRGRSVDHRNLSPTSCPTVGRVAFRVGDVRL